MITIYMYKSYKKYKLQTMSIHGIIINNESFGKMLTENLLRIGKLSLLAIFINNQ